MSYGYIPNQFANGDAVTLFLVHLDIQVVAPEPDTISRKKCTPTVALLFELGCSRKVRKVTLPQFAGRLQPSAEPQGQECDIAAGYVTLRDPLAQPDTLPNLVKVPFSGCYATRCCNVLCFVFL